MQLETLKMRNNEKVRERKKKKPKHRELDFKSWYIKLNLNCNRFFLIDLAPNGILFGFNSIGNV